MDGSITLDSSEDEGTSRIVEHRRERSWGFVADETTDRVWLLTNHPQLECRELSSGNLLWKTKLPSVAGHIYRLPTKDLLAFAFDNGNLELRRDSDGSLVRRIVSGVSSARAVSALDNDTRLVVTSSEGRAHIFSVDSGAHFAVTKPVDIPIHAVALAPDFTQMALLSRQGMLVLTPLRQE